MFIPNDSDRQKTKHKPINMPDSKKAHKGAYSLCTINQMGLEMNCLYFSPYAQFGNCWWCRQIFIMQSMSEKTRFNRSKLGGITDEC